MNIKKIIYILCLIFTFTSYNYAQVGIGTTTPDDGSILQIDSTEGAFVPPRMTTTEMQAIPSPLDGALIFNTTRNSYYVYKDNI